jgi:hypothetical protein
MSAPMQSATQTEKPEAYSLETTKFPPIPARIPDFVAQISKLHAAVLATQNIKVAHRREKELMEQVRILTEQFSDLYEKAYQVTQATAPFFDEKEQQGPWSGKKPDKAQKEVAMAAIHELDHVIREKIGSGITNPGVTITPNFLPSVEGLAAELNGLRKSLHDVMTEALNPEQPIDVAQLKIILEEKRLQFEDLRSQASNLKDPVSQRAESLDHFIENTRQNMATIWISKVVCDWELARIDLFSNIFSNLESLQQRLAGLSQEAENLKNYLRLNSFKPIDTIKIKFDKILSEPGDSTIKSISLELQGLLAEYPESAPSSYSDTLSQLLVGKPDAKVADCKEQIQAVLSRLPTSSLNEAKRQFTASQRKYADCLKLAGEYRAGAEKSIRDLQKMIDEQEKSLVASIMEIPFHSEAVRGDVIKLMKLSLSSIQGERETLLYKLTDLWKNISNQLTVDSYDHLFYEFNRIGYSIFENYGSIPKDTTYNVWGMGWSVAKKYVSSLSSIEDGQ